MNTPTLSIIVPIYNVEKYLNNCITSIIEQPFTDFELILVNDESLDGSGKICEYWAKKDKRIQVIHKKNGGVSSARNIGLQMSKGHYITFIDPDDEIDQSTYIDNISLLLSDLSIDMLQFPTYFRYGASFGYKNIPKSRILNGTEEIFSNWWEGCVLNFSIWNKIFKKEIFNNIRFPEGHVFEDMFLISDFAKLLNKVFISENGCYYYYHRENSITTSTFTLQKNLDLFIAQFKNYKMLYGIDSLKKYRVIAFLRVYRRLLTINKEYPQYDNKKEIEYLKIYSPSFNDINISEAKLKEKVHVSLIVLNPYFFQSIYNAYLKIKLHTLHLIVKQGSVI